MVIRLNTFKEGAITGTWKDGLFIKYPESFLVDSNIYHQSSSLNSRYTLSYVTWQTGLMFTKYTIHIIANISPYCVRYMYVFAIQIAYYLWLHT